MTACLPGCRGAFGYLPGLPDFVRVRDTGRETRRLEDWVEKGLHQTRWQMGSEFASWYDRLVHRFVYRPDNSTETLAGVIYASTDSHGRPFPFVAFDSMPTALWDRQPLDILSWNMPFFSDLDLLVQSIGRLSHIGQVHSRVLDARVPLALEPGQVVGAEDAEQNNKRYEQFLDQPIAVALGVRGATEGTTICQELITLLGASSTISHDHRMLRVALELPLGRTPYTRPLELRFYLELCLALLSQYQPTLTVFWQIGEEQAPGSLLIAFREPTVDLFGSLLRRDGRVRGVYLVGRGQAWPASTSSPNGEVSGSMTLAELLNTATRNLSSNPTRIACII